MANVLPSYWELMKPTAQKMPHEIKEHRWKVTLEIEWVISWRDRNSMWAVLKGPNRDDYVAALRLLKCGIDFEAAAIQKILNVLVEDKKCRSNAMLEQNA